jgi:hypothetical protein
MPIHVPAGATERSISSCAEAFATLDMPFTIAWNTTQELLTEQSDDRYDEQGDHCLDHAQAVPQQFHVVASHVPPSSTCGLSSPIDSAAVF